MACRLWTPWSWFAVSHVAVVLVAGLPIGALGETQGQPFWSQTVDGVTVRISRAQWCKPEDVGRRSDSGDDPYAKGLAIWYEVQADDPAIRPADGKKLSDYLTSLITPSLFGSPLEGTWDKVRCFA
jgi:hypothetical protein